MRFVISYKKEPRLDDLNDKALKKKIRFHNILYHVFAILSILIVLDLVKRRI